MGNQQGLRRKYSSAAIYGCNSDPLYRKSIKVIDNHENDRIDMILKGKEFRHG